MLAIGNNSFCSLYLMTLKFEHIDNSQSLIKCLICDNCSFNFYSQLTIPYDWQVPLLFNKLNDINF